MANLKLQGSTYHARLTVPKDVRVHFGNKAELWRTTDTGDKRLAAIRGAEIVAAWKRQVYAARNGVSVTEWTKSWAKEYREADARPVDDEFPSERDSAEFVMIHELEDMVQDRRMTEAQAKAAYEVATGRRVILADHKDDYLKEYCNHSIKTQAAYQAAVERFLKQFPDDHQVTPKALKQWVTGMANDDKLAAKTITRMIGQARTFWKYLVEHEIVQRDPNTGALRDLTVPKSAAKPVSRTPFMPDEIAAILSHPVALRDKKLTLLITIAMYTGARIEEVAMLQKTDLDFGKEVIRFRGTKTKAALRVVPMHPEVIPVLSSTLTGHDDDYVIGGLTIDKRGERGKAMGKRFGRLKTAMGFDKDKVFHSIRGTVSTQFEQAYVVEGVAADIVGHEKQTMTYGLYSGGTSMEQKREAVHRLKYPNTLPAGSD